MRGWIGGHSGVQEIIDIAEHGRFPCHTDVNAIHRDLGDEDDVLGLSDKEIFEQATLEAPTCRGSLAYLNNKCQLSREPRVAAEQRQVGRRDDVFKNAQEMREHHR